MDVSTNVTYTARMRSAVAARERAEKTLRRAMASLQYVTISDEKYLAAIRLIERSKELIISANIILKSITTVERIGELYNDSFDDVMTLFDSAIREAQKVQVLVETLKDKENN